MTSLPSAGFKKPLNMIENPIKPDIKKEPPRFVWSRKHWNVDTGSTLLDTEPYVQFIEPSVLTQSRDYNKTIYGQSSHKDIVNAEFRPPYLDQFEDLGPLTRVPVKTKAIIPHLNPGTDSDGTAGYLARNQRITNVDSALTDRIKNKEWRPTFFSPIESPQDNSVLPDLESKLPSVSANSGWEYNVTFGPQHQEVKLRSEKLNPTLQTRPNPSFTLNGRSQFEDYQAKLNRPMTSTSSGFETNINFKADNPDVELKLNNPQVSASSGYESHIQLDSENPNYNLKHNNPQVPASSGYESHIHLDSEKPNYHLQHNNPQVPGYSGYESHIQLDSEKPNYDLKYNNPQVPGYSGYESQIQLDSEKPNYDLKYNNPQVPGYSGYESQIQLDSEIPEYHLETKLTETPLQVLNPGSETGYKQNFEHHNTDDYITTKRPSYSYAARPEFNYKTDNYQSHQPHFKQKLQPDKSYGQLSQTGATYHNSRMYDRSMYPNSISKKVRKMNNSGDKPIYRFGK